MNTTQNYGTFEHMSPKKKKNYITLKRGVFFGLLCILVLAIVGAGFLWYKKNQSPEQRAEQETNKILKEMSQFVLLPEETPALFTISDIDTLVQEQPFFNGAQNGDVLLIFPQAVKAIVYSPDRNIIVNMGPVTGGDVPPEGIQTSQPVSVSETPSAVSDSVPPQEDVSVETE